MTDDFSGEAVYTAMAGLCLMPTIAAQCSIYYFSVTLTPPRSLCNIAAASARLVLPFGSKRLSDLPFIICALKNDSTASFA